MRFNSFDCPACNGLGLQITKDQIAKCDVCDGTGHKHSFTTGRLRIGVYGIEGTGMSVYGGLNMEML